jgi:hypothetical protein
VSSAVFPRKETVEPIPLKRCKVSGPPQDVQFFAGLLILLFTEKQLASHSVGGEEWTGQGQDDEIDPRDDEKVLKLLRQANPILDIPKPFRRGLYSNIQIRVNGPRNRRPPSNSGSDLLCAAPKGVQGCDVVTAADPLKLVL